MKHWIFAVALICLGSSARADSEMKVTLDKGSYIQVASVTGSSVAGTAIMTANPKRVYVIMSTLNNTGLGTTVFVGTVTATQNGVTHSNITNGLQVASSSTFILDGAMTDTAYFTCPIGIGSCVVRVLEGINR